MSNLSVADIRVFAPAKNFGLSKAFYVALGWRVRWDGGTLVLMELGDHRFYLDDHYSKGWAESFRFHITVEDAQAWYDHISSVLQTGNFEGARVDAPKQEYYGALVTYAHDPSGILLDFAQWPTARPSASNSE